MAWELPEHSGVVWIDLSGWRNFVVFRLPETKGKSLEEIEKGISEITIIYYGK